MQNRSARKIFVTGTGTGIGKTYVSAILAEALSADYWKPVQAGLENGTDSEWVKSHLNNPQSIVHEEKYKLKFAASPHIAAKKENIRIDLNAIKNDMPSGEHDLIIEGAGGLMVPLNEKEFVSDLVVLLNVPVILVSRNQLGSINHSLLTARVCKQMNITVLGWVFNDDYLDYEKEIVEWTSIPSIASIPFCGDPGKQTIKEQAEKLRQKLQHWLW